ncbi:cell division protein FtsZ [Rubellimicrobium sp. CFH 75288]|uniref:cell division protein FtsZ n=1 Tax=Rubellimicrobium sp. CFH 75288 TaxID=2697034 RepID=UPI0014120A91|nr:cell division protein FtsZ [Rubellimicrobium sp. CFH 75288]NAZ36395.1 cell division protein FtsZ [Rubellimicrobium sp. CFH 75288]
MALNLSLPGQEELKPRITVFGVGGAGGNAVNNMIEKQLDGVEFVVANTDAQALKQSHAPAKIQMGVKVTEGLGAGARPSVGAAAAEESIQQIVDHLAGAHMCFITAGMGGGTGTGAAPVIAQAARELGVLTVGVVTKPFQFEGGKRMRQAEEGIEALQKHVDTLIIIPNQNLFRLANENTTFTEAFALADDVLYQGVKGVTDLMVRPGLINLDFADVRAVMDEMGKAMMGTGEAEGQDRATHAAEKAIANPLLDEISLNGAKGVLINITGGYDLTLFELDEAANIIREKVDPEANIIVGSTLDPDMGGRMRVSVVATGIDASASRAETPLPRRSMSAPLRERVSLEEPAAAPAPRPSAPKPAFQPAARQPQPVARVAQQPAPQPASPAPARAAAAAPAVPRQPEPEPAVFEAHHFDGIGTPPVDDFADIEQALADDGMPPPAYQPQPAPAAQAPQPPAGRPAAGTPTPEAVARLRTLMAQRAQEARQTAPAEPVRPEPAARQPAPERRGGGLGLSSLIHRMTGQSAEAAAPAPAAPRPAPRAETPTDPDAERADIPAFLRRQAN